MKTMATLVSLLALAMAAIVSPPLGAHAESSNYPGDLTKGKHLTIYVEGLADPSSGFFRVLNNGAQQAGKDLGVDVKYVYPASVDLASYTEKIEETIAAKPDGILILGIGDLDAVAKEAKDKGIAVAFNPAPSVKDKPLRDPNDVYVSRVGADEYAAGQMAANRFAEKGREVDDLRPGGSRRRHPDRALRRNGAGRQGQGRQVRSRRRRSRSGQDRVDRRGLSALASRMWTPSSPPGSPPPPA